MSIDALLQNIAEQGLLGVLLIIVGWAYYKKDKQIAQLNEEKLEMAERVFKIAETLSGLINQNGGKNV